MALNRVLDLNVRLERHGRFGVRDAGRKTRALGSLVLVASEINQPEVAPSGPRWHGHAQPTDPPEQEESCAGLQ